MKTTNPQTQSRNIPARFGALKQLKSCAAIFALTLTGLPSVSFAAAGTWNGSTDTNWNTAANWTGGVPSGGDAIINTTNPRVATVTGTISATPVDIRVGTGGTGRVDHLAGNVFTGNGNWMFLGYQAGNAIYNLADTTAAGGTFTGYGQGSGNLYVGGLATPTGNLLLGLDNGTRFTLNINSSGTLAAGYLCVGGVGTCGGTVNMDNGTVNISGETQIGGNQYGQNGGTNLFNMSGGTFTANVLVLSRGNNNASVIKGYANITGGTLNTKQWFTLGFAGSASAFAGATNSGGTINVNTNGGGNMEMCVYDPMSAAFVQTSGALNLCNSAYMSFGNGGNHSGTSTFTQNGGTVTFFSNVAVTPGGTGYLRLGTGGDTGTYTYHLNGGTLTVPNIQKTAASAVGNFNFNGGTLKPTASTTTFITGLSAANVMSGGAIVDTTNFNVTIAQNLADGGGGGGLTKIGSGTLSLGGGYGYTGPTFVRAGTLGLDGSQASSGSSITVSNAALALSLGTAGSTISAGALTLTGNTALNLNYASVSTPSAAALTVTSLSLTGTNTINVSGSALVVGQVQLISLGASVPTNNFKLGTLPTGVVAVLTNSGTSLDLLITGTGQNLTWYGADSVGTALTNWNVNTSSNWNSGANLYKQYAGNSYGDNVTFDDTLYLQQGTNVNLPGRIVPATVFMNSTLPYSITGAGGIDGVTSLQVTNTGSLYLGTSNSYKGGTVIGNSTLIITNDSALGTNTGGVTLAGGTLQVNGTTASSRPVTVTAAATIGVASGATAQFNGSVTNSASLTNDVAAGAIAQLGGTTSGSGSFTKNGSGTLNVPGNILATGLINFNNGTSVVSGAVSPGTSELWVSDGTGNSGVLNVQPGAVLSVNNWLPIGRTSANGVMNVNGGSVVHTGGGSISCGTLGTAPNGTINLNSGSISNLAGETYLGEGSGEPCFGNYNQIGGTAYLGNFYVGRGDSGSGIGTANISGGTTTVGNLEIGYGNNNTRIGTNVLTIGAGATVTATGFARLAFAGSANLQGILTNNGGTLNVGSTALYLSYWPDGCSGHVAHNSGALNMQNSSSIIFGQNGAQFSANDFVQNGGNVTFYSDAGATVGGTGSLNLGNSGSGSNTYTLAGGTLTVPQVRQVSGTAIGTFNFSGGTLSAAASSATFITGLTAANVMMGGAIIDTAGNNITIAQVLLDGDTLGGGLTKIGNGTLTLNGVNTYTGPTKINAGTLAGTGTIVGTLTNSATLAPGDGGIGSLTVNSNITLKAGSTNLFDVDGTGPANDSVIAGGSVTYGGVLKIASSGTFTPGQQFVLFSGTGATNAGNFASLVGSPGAGLAYSFTNGVLSVVTGVASNPTNITFSASGGNLNLSWPSDHLGWILQSQTNSRAIGISNNWADITGSSSLTATNFPLNPADPTVFYRLRIP